MEQPVEKKLSHNGVEMTYYVSGQGTPLILMHGWGCTSQTVRSIALIAEAAGCRVFNVDFPGFGKSGEPSEVWGVEDYTRLIEKLAETDGIINPVLVGHSFGGRVAILFSSRNLCDKVVLVDAAGIVNKSLKKSFRIYRFKLLKKLARAFLSKGKYEEWLENYRKKKGSADYASASPRMRQILSKVVNEDLRHVLHKIQAPVLLLWGVNDTATPLKDAKLMQKSIPDAGLVEFEGAGHYSFLDSPHRFRSVLTHFLTHRATKQTT